MRDPLRRRLGLAAAFAVFAAPASAAPIVPSSPTTGWNPIAYPSLLPDYSDDQQTGIPEADIVGDLLNPAFYSLFDDAGTPSLTDGSLAFRVRLGADKNPPGFGHFMGVGLDANSDGALDLFLAVENSGTPDRIAIYDAGPGANTGPSTTTIDTNFLFTYALSAANYDFQAVTATSDPTATSFDLDADGDTDHFLTWVIPFSDIVSALAGQSINGITQDSTLRYVVGSSNQPNALNQDLGGPNGGTSSGLTWGELGGISHPYSASGTLIPEPGTAVLLALGLGLLAARARRRGAH
jgi:hypothetical protein